MPRQERSIAGRLVLALAWLIPVGILVQAALAGQGWFVTPDLLVLHGGVGHGVLTLSVVLAAVLLVRQRLSTGSVLGVLIVLGLVGQTGLGYAGRRGELDLASSLHIPLGVVVFGAAVALALWLTLAPRVHADAATAEDA